MNVQSESASAREYSYTIRKSIAFVIVRLVITELLIAILHFSLRAALQIIQSYFNLEMFPFLAFEFIFIQILNLYLVLVVLLTWMSEYYILNPREVIVRRGILRSQSTTYEFANLQSMTIVRDLWGKLFGYGTIRLFNPVLKEEVALSMVPDPEKYGAIIQQHQPEITPLIRRR